MIKKHFSKTRARHLTSLLFFFITFNLFSSFNTYAVPAFARQTDMTCNSCHFQSFPALNSFGRVFRAGGY
ncbi:MAG: cytochrome C, partial [Gammaproteobacteria bacterium]|nr:cytochrome C [Gammaproteobacteria bacterium]